MDKIEKFLRSLTAKEYEAMVLLMEQIRRDPHLVPGMIPLAGKKGWYRVGMGSYRLMFTIDPKTKTVEIKRVTRRSEKTYEDL